MLSPTDPLTPAEARALTDEIAREFETLGEKIVRLYRGEAHVALGYDNWAVYPQAEIAGYGDRSRAQIYKMLEAALVRVELMALYPGSEKSDWVRTLRDAVMQEAKRCRDIARRDKILTAAFAAYKAGEKIRLAAWPRSLPTRTVRTARRRRATSSAPVLRRLCN